MRPVLTTLAVLTVTACGDPSGDDTSPDADVPTIPLLACGEITTSGTYLLSGDLAAPAGMPCIHVHDAIDVFLRCAGHSVAGEPALVIRNVHGFGVRDCTLRRTTVDFISEVATLETSDNGLIEGCTIEQKIVKASRLTDTRVTGNTFNATFQQQYSSRNVIEGNTFVSPYTTMGQAVGLVITSLGADNQIIDNTMDGRWDGVQNPVSMTGTDDAIIVQDETRAYVARNDITNIWDCGIETLGTISSSTFVDNRIRVSAYCGIGGWYWSNLVGSTISGNTAENTRQLLAFFRIYGLRPAGWDPQQEAPADSVVAFADNIIEANRLIDPVMPSFLASSNIPIFSRMDYNGAVSAVPGERVPTPSEYQLTNNLFRNNDFTRTNEAPRWGTPVVPGLVIDGGGNVCMTPSAPSYPIACN